MKKFHLFLLSLLQSPADNFSHSLKECHFLPCFNCLENKSQVLGENFWEFTVFLDLFEEINSKCNFE